MNLRRRVRRSHIAPVLLACTLSCAAGAADAAVIRFDNQALFQIAAPAATSLITFERGLGPAQSSGFLPTFTEQGFVTFNAGANYRQEIIEGLNVGESGNDVYLTLATDKTKPTLDVTFGGGGVSAFGFDFKDSAGNGTAADVPMLFTFTLFSGATNLGSFMASTIPGGTTFSFLGFTSSQAITELTAIATVPGASPNLDLVLDNVRFAAIAGPTAVPEPATALLLGFGLLSMAGLTMRSRRRSPAATRVGFAAA